MTPTTLEREFRDWHLGVYGADPDDCPACAERRRIFKAGAMTALGPAYDAGFVAGQAHALNPTGDLPCESSSTARPIP
jgi:hypothetical protein